MLKEFASGISSRRFSFVFYKQKAAKSRRTPKAAAISSRVVDCTQLLFAHSSSYMNSLLHIGLTSPRPVSGEQGPAQIQENESAITKEIHHRRFAFQKL